MRSVDTVVLTLPVRVSVSVGKQFLLDQEQWIRNKASLFEEIPSLFEYFDSGNVVWLDDTPREVIISSKNSEREIILGLIVMKFSSGFDLQRIWKRKFFENVLNWLRNICLSV